MGRAHEMHVEAIGERLDEKVQRVENLMITASRWRY